MDRTRVSVFSYNFFYPIPLAICLLIMRRLLERYCFVPAGISMGLEPSQVLFKENTSTLMTTLKSTTWLSPKHHQVKLQAGLEPILGSKCLHTLPKKSTAQFCDTQFGFGGGLGILEALFAIQLSNITKYIQITNNFAGLKSPANHKVSRFCRSCWHFVYYLVEFNHGMIILWDKPWLWNIRECWTDYPHQKLTVDVLFYYVTNLAYYWSLLIELFLHERRKDFTESVVHHVAAIFLIYISLIMQTFRIGTLVIVVLFVSDIFLEIAKLLKYLNFDRKSTLCFIGFSVVWIISRLAIYPFWILKHTYTYVPKAIVMNPSIYFLILLLTLIAIMNGYWTYQIFKVLWRAYKGTNFEDERSDDESDDAKDDSKDK